MAPLEFTQAIADAICERIMDGESLRQVCRSDDMPARSAVHKWLSANPNFADQYARACEIRADVVFDEMFDIADDGTNDWMNARDDEGGEAYKLNGEHVQRSKLRIDARKWALARMSPKKYGDKAALELTGANGGPIQTQEIDPTKLSTAALAELMAAMNAASETEQGGSDSD